jgi:hypothetical protein
LFPFCADGDSCGRPSDEIISGKIGHTDLPGNAVAQEFIIHQLGHPIDFSKISTGSAIGAFAGVLTALKSYLQSYFLDPVDGYLIDAQGRRLGYTAATGPLTEIPGSIWFGQNNGIGWITEPVDGPMQMILKGLGEEFVVKTAIELGDAREGTEASGTLGPGVTLTLGVALPVPSSVWHNSDNPLDVDGSGEIQAIDALILINRINALGTPTPLPDGQEIPPPFYDVNANGIVDPNDVLRVINFINRQSRLAGEAIEPTLIRLDTPTRNQNREYSLDDKLELDPLFVDEALLLFEW